MTRVPTRVMAAFGAAMLLALATTAGAQDLWSNPATWGGTAPVAGSHVVVPGGRRIILDVTPPPLASVTINGVLTFGPRDVDLTAGWIAVHGMLEVGTEEVPYPHKATITLTGAFDENVMGMGARVLGAMNGGRIEIHGARRADTDWAVLARNARPGDTSVEVELVEPNKTALGWRPGDLLVIAPSGRDPWQVDAVTVTAVVGRQVSFTPALRHPHWGELQTIEGRLVDERAEVGLLTRNVVVQGAADGIPQNLGGHIMIMAGGIGRVEGAELRHMGQRGRLGRYPMHWHLAGNAPIDYLRFSSVWNSFHRAVALHRTNGVEVRGNVAANVWSHMFVVGEDGNETGNVVEDNLGILTRRLPDEAFVFARLGAPGASGPTAQDEWRPATFWVNNPNNVVRGNRAAGGVDAIGFFYDDDHGLATPTDRAGTDFASNVAHSYLTSQPADEPQLAASSGIGLLVRRASPATPSAPFATLTAYQNSVAGAWLDQSGDVLQDAVLVGNTSGAILGRGTLSTSLVAGATANRTTAHARESERGGVRTVALATANAPVVQGVTFVDQSPAAFDLDGGHLLPGNRVSNVSLVRTPVPVFLRDRRPDHSWSGALVDVDGTLTGAAGGGRVTGSAVSATSTFMPGWGSFAPGGAFLSPLEASSGPSGLAAAVRGSTVTFSWYPASVPVTSYSIEAGVAPGRTDVTLPTGAASTTYTVSSAPTGEFFVRVRARLATGATMLSNEIRVRVGAVSCLVPESPAPLSATTVGAVVSLRWSASPGAGSYRVLVGRTSGAANVTSLDVAAPATTISGAAPVGDYFVRAIALNSCGQSAPSNEVRVGVR